MKALIDLYFRFFALTPRRNKRIGRFLTAIAALATSVEVAFSQYPGLMPSFLHKMIIGTIIITAIWAGYHGQKVKR